MEIIPTLPLREEESLFTQSARGKIGFRLPRANLPERRSIFSIPEDRRRTEMGLPMVSEREVVRHFTRLSQRNFHIDSNFYPLGSCTMKYNPVAHERWANLTAFRDSHPATPPEWVQGDMEILFTLADLLQEITGLKACSLVPAAGSHGELLSLLMIKQYFQDREENRTKVLIPDSAHGTNPASVSLAGFTAVSIPSCKEGDQKGLIDLDALRSTCDRQTAAFMITNPNTLGIFEENITAIKSILEENGAFFYLDGANYNAMIGKIDLGKMGVNVCHLNLHKTFSTPHGGGGPGAGAILTDDRLKDYLPSPTVVQTVKEGKKRFTFDRPSRSIGKAMAHHGHFLVCLRALAYILAYGNQITLVAENAVLLARWLADKLKQTFPLSTPKPSMHEFTLSDKNHRPKGIETKHIAKALLDQGFHPPTVYFPLIVPGAMMIEPTETEPPAELMDFAQTLANLIDQEPAKLAKKPSHTPRSQIDEVQAARHPILKETTD